MKDERSVTFKISADLYSILEDRAVAVAKAAGKRINIGAVAGRMVEEHFKCERESKRAKRRPNRNKKASVDDTSAYMLEPDFRIPLDALAGVRIPVIDSVDFSTDHPLQPGYLPDTEVPAQDVPKDDVVEELKLTQEMVDEVIDASMVMTFIEDFRSWRLEQQRKRDA